MKRIFLILILAVIVFSFLVCFPKGSESGGVYISIEKGESSRDIGMKLEKGGLIWWSPVFRAYAYLTGVAGDLKAGEYFLSPSMSMPQIVRKIIEGEIVGEEIIQIIEGWNLRDIGFYFENRGMFQAEEIWEVAGLPATDYSKNKIDLADFSSDYDFLQDKPVYVGLEGYLFPDTYKINRNSDIEDILKKMLDNFDDKLNPKLRADIAEQGKNVFDIITMASVIEKEVRTEEDKALVSGIMWKRLKAGVPLQSCASITYITGKRSTVISKEDKEIDSLFNTYKYAGLPLGPICNPGLKSIKAAVYPQESDYWYFLNRQDTGETIFSKTLEEHNEAKIKYLY